MLVLSPSAVSGLIWKTKYIIRVKEDEKAPGKWNDTVAFSYLIDVVNNTGEVTIFIGDA